MEAPDTAIQRSSIRTTSNISMDYGVAPFWVAGYLYPAFPYDI